MKATLPNALIALLTFSSYAYATEAAGAGDGGFLLVSPCSSVFLCADHCLPAGSRDLMLVGILKGLFGRDRGSC